MSKRSVPAFDSHSSVGWLPIEQVRVHKTEIRTKLWNEGKNETETEITWAAISGVWSDRWRWGWGDRDGEVWDKPQSLSDHRPKQRQSSSSRHRLRKRSVVEPHRDSFSLRSNSEQRLRKYRVLNFRQKLQDKRLDPTKKTTRFLIWIKKKILNGSRRYEQ